MSEDQRQAFVKTLKTLANPIRLKMIASVYDEPKHVYALSKELGIAYPLAHLHLKNLKKRGLVEEVREVERVKGMPTVKYYAPSDFELILTPKSIRDIFQNNLGGEKNG